MDELTPIDEIKAIVESKATEPQTDSVAVPIPVEEQPVVRPITEENEFQKNINKGLNAIVADAYENDEGFKKELAEKTTEAAKSYADLEKDRAELERKYVNLHAESIQTKQELEQFKQADHRWDNQRSRRRFVYDGVKPILSWVGVTEPMNIGLMVFMTIVMIIPFLIGKPIESLIVGANPDNRKKQAQAWIWTLLALVLTGVVIVAIVVPCKYFGVIK